MFDALYRKYYWAVKLLGFGTIGGLVMASAVKFFAADPILAPAEGAIDYSKIEVEAGDDDSNRRPQARSGDRMVKMQAKSDITGNNLFCPTCQPMEEEVGTSGPVVPGEIKSRLPLILLATMESDDPAYSMATILDTESNALSAYIKDDTVRPNVTLTSVERGRVVLQNGAQAEYLEIGGTAPPPQAQAATPQVPAKLPRSNPAEVDGANEAIKCSDENNCVVDRAFVNQLMANPAVLTKQARVVPAIRNGQTKGFKFYGIRPGSLPQLLGVKNGDMVTAVNGNELTGLDQAMGLYSKLRSAGHLSITIERKGQPVQKEIDIK